MMRAKAMTADAVAEVTTPEWQPGKSTIQLNVSGRIELQ
jgi:predicted secreted protein